MPFLFREIVFCECGRPAQTGSCTCRTCYEDGLRRRWRDEYRIDAGQGIPEPVKFLKPQIRILLAPQAADEDAEGEMAGRN